MSPACDDVDRLMMRRALELARLGLYTTDPNPRVGCVIASNGRIVGEGWHRKAGEPHAEVYALEQAGAQARGATAYVTLEPCSHYGRTPPCADALINAGVKRVVAALRDPNPRVNGAGLERLAASGIEVASGLVAAAAEELNVGFVKRMRHGLPWVTIKIGASMDGRTALANGASRWITSAASRADVQRWRARSSAVMTGSGTVLTDDPQLNVRAPELDLLGRQPLRVICDTHLRTPQQARVLQQPGSALLFASSETVSARGASNWPNAEVLAVAADERGLDLSAVLKVLGARGCNEVLVEAGPRLSGRFLELQLADELLLYLAPALLGQDARAMLQLPRVETMVERLEFELIETQPFDNDLRLRYRPKKR